MLEKIGLPAKPSLRGNNWVVDASHCQGCSSQFTFINRKHHCRRCGGLFCGSCTQQRMYLRGQGESPVRICEPCKTLEEAARFEMRHGHKNRPARGSTKPASNNEEDILSKILGNGGNEPISSDKDSVDLRSTMQRATSNASSSKSGMLTDPESTTPEELKQQAVEEKKKYKVLKAEGKPEEALRAFKRGKELERQAATLEIELRKTRKKTVSSNTINDEKHGKRPREKDDLASELRELGWSDLDLRDSEKKPVTMTLEGELSTLIKEVSLKPDKGILGTDKSEVVAIKKRALAFKREGKLVEAKEELKRAKILEKKIEEQELLGGGDDSDDEFTSLIRSMDIDEKDVFAPGNDFNRNFDFDHLLDDGPGVDFEVTDEDLDDPEMSAALQSLGWTEDHESQSQSQPSVDKEAILSEIQSLKREALSKKRAGNTAEALALLKKAKLLETDVENDVSGQTFAGQPSRPDPDRKTAPKSKLVIQRELLALKKKALALRREGRIDEADQELAKGKALEQQLEELESGQKVKPTKNVDFSAPMDIENEEKEDVTDMDMNDPSYLSVLQNLGWKEEDDNVKVQTVEVEEPKQEISTSKKSKIEIQRELLGLKRKSLTLRRQGNIEEAEEVLQMAKALEAQLAEIEEKTQVTEVDKTSLSKNVAKNDVFNDVFLKEEPRVAIKEEVAVDLNEPKSIQHQILDHKRKALGLKREGKLAEAKEELRLAKLLEKTTLNATDDDPSHVPSTSNVKNSDFALVAKTEDSPPKLSSRDRFKMQQESLGHKRQALKLRREGRIEEAEAEFELAKNLESQLEALTAGPESTKPVDHLGVEDLLDSQLLSALREIGIDGGGAAQPSPEPVKPPALTKTERPKNDRTEIEEQIKAEKVKAVNLKRSGKQGEALDALRRAKLLEKKLNSVA